MFQKYILRKFQEIETCLSDCGDMRVLCHKKNTYVIEDAFGNKMNLHKSTGEKLNAYRHLNGIMCFRRRFSVFENQLM